MDEDSSLFRVRHGFGLFHGIADGGFEESQLYYTTPQAKKQAGMLEMQGKKREIIDWLNR